MQKRIWKEYNRKLIQRGSIDFYLDPKILKKIKKFHPKSSGGRPLRYSTDLVQVLIIFKIQFSLSYRALEGFAKSIFKTSGRTLEIPSYSLICKRAKDLEQELPKLSCRRPKVVLIDASGIKVYGEGEWKRKIHGVGRPRKWLKLHIVVDEKTQEIIGAELTESTIGDSSMIEPLLKKTPKSVREVKADGAYDGRRSRNIIKSRGALPIIPPRKNGRLQGDKERDKAVCIIKGLGGGCDGKIFMGQAYGLQ